jgi:hypothetical protein
MSTTAAHVGIASIPTAATLSRRNVGFGNEPRPVPQIFTPLTGDTGPTRYAIDEFGFVLPLVIGATAVWFWRRRDVALAAWRADAVDGGPPANRRLQPSAAGSPA